MAEAPRVFGTLRVWHDLAPRTGADNMAVDQLLMEQCGEVPVLRIYRWSEPTVSFGYFNTLREAEASFPAPPQGNLSYVRRWTGGGTVDHRVDVTYTLAVPRSEELARLRGAESYRLIHRALAAALADAGQPARLAVTGSGGGARCFAHPVAYDLTDLEGRKVAGAGQRRSRGGLLHQGSVVPGGGRDGFWASLAETLPAKLARSCADYSPGRGLLGKVRGLAESRYGSEAWLKKR